MIKPATIEAIKIIAHALGELNNNAVFVGGATLPFYIPEIYFSQVRPTEDIDVVMEILGPYQNSINEESLRKKGFKNDTDEGAPICRWKFRDFKIDIMSTDTSAFGFTNQWYKEGVICSKIVPSLNVDIKIFSLPYFIASKIEAFKSRGQFDFMGSKDMEDIISVLEVSSKEIFEDEFFNTSEKLRQYLKAEFQILLNNSHFIEAIPGAIFNRLNSVESSNYVRLRMKNFCETI